MSQVVRDVVLWVSCVMGSYVVRGVGVWASCSMNASS